MTERAVELICLIRESKDPEKAMDIALDLLTRLLAGKSMESIAASYGVKCDSTNQVAQEAKDDPRKQ